MQVCKCCGYAVHKERISICCDPDELTFLGSAYPLLFLLTKYFALVILLLFMYIGSFSVIISYYFECNNPKNCVKFFGLVIYNFE